MKKRLASAYKLGKEGKQAPSNSSRSLHIFHGLGKRSLARTVAINGELDQQKKGRLHEAISRAEGVNKQALELIEQSAKIPNQPSSNPDWGVEKTDADGKRSHEWVLPLSSGLDQDPSRKAKTPLVEPLGGLYLDSTDWSHNGFTVPVDNVFIVCTAPIDTDGSLRAASTRMYMNSRSYDPDSTELDNKATFTGGVKIYVDPTGQITEFGVTKSNSTGYTVEDPTKAIVDLVSFFNNTHRAVAETAITYQSIRDDLH